MIILIFLFFSVALGGATTVVCGPGQFYDSTVTETCAPQFPAPLAFVGALMDSRYTACDISFERLMCGGAASDSPRALQYAELRYRRALRKALRQQASPWWRSCLGRPQRHETLIEYKHVAERILGDLFVPADLPAAWGRLARAGYEEAAGSPFMLHKRDGQWYLSAPSTTILELGEGQFFQALQAGPIAYNVIELQQRIGYLVQMAQVLHRHRSSESITSVVHFSDLPSNWPWSLYLGSTQPPAPEDLIICDDLQYVEWVLQNADKPPLSVHHWRAWLEFHVAQAHRGHVAISEDQCMLLTLALAPEIANNALMATVIDMNKVEVEVKQLGDHLLEGKGGVSVLPQRRCPVEASMSPDRFDHNVNLIRAWRWAMQQTAQEPNLAFVVDWPLLQPPLFNVAYGEVSKYAIFGTTLLYARQGLNNMTGPLQDVVRRVWPLIPTDGDRQHFFMVFAQAFCNTPGINVDDVLRRIPEFSEVFGCYPGQGMYVTNATA